MSKLRLNILFNGNSMKIEAEEEKVKAIMQMYQNAIEHSDDISRKIIFAGNLTIRVAKVIAMFISPAGPTAQEEIVENYRKQQREGDWWKRGEQPPGEEDD